MAQGLQDLRAVYLYIVDDVISKMRPEFVQEGADETVLMTLRSRWEQNLKTRGLLEDPDTVTGQSTEKQEDDAAAATISKPAEEADQQLPSSTAAATTGAAEDGSKKRPFDGQGPAQPAVKPEPYSSGPSIPQTDGNGDEYPDDGAEEEADDYDGDDADADRDDADADRDDADRDDADADADRDEDEDDELDLDDEDQTCEEENIPNLGFALYDKVHRAKSRWRCTLRMGVFHLNGKDYLFNKAMADLQF
eukprot:jgi/Chrzof1/13159/Cz07g22070.t1